MNFSAFEYACGSVPGRDHIEREGLLIGRNNQDGFATRTAADGSWFVGVVCDGCGGKSGSDLGAKLGALLIAGAVVGRLQRLGTDGSLLDSFFDDVREDVLAELRTLALRLSIGSSFTQVIADHFLFTVVGVLVFRDKVYRFSVGDGVYIVNDELTELGPFPGNQPPYLAYALLKTKFSAQPELLEFTVQENPLSDIQSLLIGSDGVLHLQAAVERNIPGKKETVGPLSEFWPSDRFFRNQDALRRKLALVNSSVTRLTNSGGQLVTESGLLPDDTTLIVIRRKNTKAE
jgi:hypothetical protein